jgi:hypothetical protein
LSDKGEESRTLYANLMDEINVRLEIIRDAAGGRFRLHPMLAHEFAWFQLRMLCETLACGCLVAHGDITNLNFDKKLQREYSADAIIRKMETLHDDFFPKSRIFHVNQSVQVIDRPAGYLTKDEFLNLYGETHSWTHRGSLKFISERPPYKPVEFWPVLSWAKKIRKLLDNHLIWSPNHRRLWLVVMQSPQMNGHVLVALGEAPPEESFTEPPLPFL